MAREARNSSATGCDNSRRKRDLRRRPSTSSDGRCRKGGTQEQFGVMKMTKTCVRCGKEIYGHKLAKYCGKCREEVIREQKIESRERKKEPDYTPRYKPKKRACACCGEEFYGFPLSKYCEKCRPKVRRERDTLSRQRRRKEQSVLRVKPVNPTGKPLEEWICEAAEFGIDYGLYRTMIERMGMTKEQVQAITAGRSPCCHSHCKAFRKMA